MKLFRTRTGPVVELDDRHYRLPGVEWDELITREDLAGSARAAASSTPECAEPRADELLAPVDSQEVWAAGVTYRRSRAARMEEAEEAGGGDFYDRVYDADRPELFFKAAPWRVVGPGRPVRVRADSTWSVPEPELTLVVSPRAEIVGYTVGNDMSARDIEGENPLYLPQAKTYDGSCAVGPCVLVHETELSPETTIALEITRAGAQVFRDHTTLAHMKRTPAELVAWLFRHTSFPRGCLLMTGTGIVPPTDFTLAPGDVVRIDIDTIGSLVNPVGRSIAQ